MDCLIYPTVIKERSDLWRYAQGRTMVTVMWMGEKSAPRSQNYDRVTNECREVRFGLLEPIVTETTSHAAISYRLTSLGQQALDAIENGFVWNNDNKDIDLFETERYWRTTMMLLTTDLDDEFAASIKLRIKEFHGGPLSHLVDEAVMVLMNGAAPNRPSN